ncbi:MAG: zinc ribbon domain-containing protein [Candidatus Heimdallarchaeota archaeon]|nr:zinc ribbon domain-containing protein [Candidatus Heimdallarchaeota archaeon]
MERPIDIGTTLNRAAKCPKCGKTMVQYSELCPHCGYDPKKSQVKNVRKEPIIIECPKCKTLNEPGSVTCKSCGINFVEYEQSKPLDMSVLTSAKKRKKT